MMNLEKIYDRTKLVLKEKGIKKVKSSHVLICGLGGVGSYTFEALLRIGIGKISVIDKDIVDITNINRQLIADTSTIGKAKVEVAKDRGNIINPEIKINTFNVNISTENFCNVLDEIKDSIDYIVDAIDNIDGKIGIIREAKKRNIKIISSMGMANKLNPLDIKVSDISNTKVCPLAKIMRKRLKEEGISKVKVVYSEEEIIRNDSNVLGSVSFVPSVAGLVIASEIVKDIVQ